MQHHNVSVARWDATMPARWPQGTYDAVVVWDVLEHIYDLEGAVRSIAGMLRPGGWFISKSTFATSDGQHCHIHLAKHVRYADVPEFNRLLESVGFRFRGQLKPNLLSRLMRTVGWPYAVSGIRIVPRLKHGGNFLVHVKES